MSKLEEIEEKVQKLEQGNLLLFDQVMTISEVALFLKISEWQTSKLAHSGILPMTRKAGNYRIMKSKLIEWVNQDDRKARKNGR